jgi:fatty-acyl-CoA synthase
VKVCRIADRADIAAIEARPYAEFMAHRHIGAALEDVAARHPARTALCFLPSADPAEPARTWSYREFIADVRRAAHVFRGLAAPEAPRVALLLPAIPQAHIALWGAEAAGVACPINHLLGAANVSALIRASRANILIALGKHAQFDIVSRVSGLREACPQLRHVMSVGAAPDALDFEALLAAMGSNSPVLGAVPNAQASRPAALFHTGGTTGSPRLWQLSHGNQLHAAWGTAQMLGLCEHDVMLDGFPVFHVAGPLVYGLSTLLSGGCLVLPTALGMRNTGFVQRCWEFVERHGITLLASVPTFLSSLLAADASGADIRSVRALLTGGSPLPAELARRFENRFGIPVRNILGMTECAGSISVEPLLGPRVPGSCGLPLPFTEVSVIGADGAEHPGAPGVSGVLCVRGPGVGAGDVDTNDEHRAAPPDHRLVTGDIGHIDAESRVHVTGRAKDLIIRSGHNIDPALIEEALLAHPGVRMAAAVGQPDEYAGELPVAYVLLEAKATCTAEELLAFARLRIPERPAFPKRIDVLEALPMTAIGKVYKVALRLRAMERVVSERMADAGLASRVSVEGIDEGSRLSLVFRRTDALAIGADAASLHRLMSGFAISYRLADAPAWQNVA